MRQAEEFWEELLAQVEAEQVIPVIGPGLLTVATEGGEAPLYRALAERLLQKYGLAAATGPAADAAAGDAAVLLRPSHELNDAVCALTNRGRRVQDLYRPVHDLLRALTDGLPAEGLQPLRDLASVSAFKLFVSTTPDDLLARAIDVERHGGAAKTDHIVFAPKLASGTLGDLPDVRSSGYTAVCHLFGRASPSPFVFAIHDEDTLEFVHNLQINGAEAMKRLFSELRQRNLLLVGCNFADWLSRFFIRVSNTQRLGARREKREFLIEQAADDGGLTLFLERFSPSTWLFPGQAREFVAELARRWRERHPLAPTAHAEEPAPRPRPDAAFFVSYSRDDLAEARQVFADLQELGADVAWFDKSDLKPGDDWSQKIRDAIGGCYVFLPLVSANTEAREEGFFREEWTQASERSRRIQGRTFIVPVVVDRDYTGQAGRYRLVPDTFLEAHYGHAPAGRLSDELRQALTRLIRERRSPRSA